MKTRLAATRCPRERSCSRPVAAAATAGPVFGLRAVGNPKLGYFVYYAGARRGAQGAVIVSNTGTARGTVKLFAADASTGQTTGTVYLTDGKPKRAGAWITARASALTLAPGADPSASRSPCTCPPAQTPGEWVGGIVAETTQPAKPAASKRKAGVQIKIRNQTIIAVQVNVPGPPVVSFKIGSVKTGGQRGFQQVVVHIANTGNVLASRPAP